MMTRFDPSAALLTGKIEFHLRTEFTNGGHRDGCKGKAKMVVSIGSFVVVVGLVRTVVKV
jgi:hypothetical protein